MRRGEIIRLRFPPCIEAMAFLERGRGGLWQNRVLLAALFISFISLSLCTVHLLSLAVRRSI